MYDETLKVGKRNQILFIWDGIFFVTPTTNHQGVCIILSYGGEVRVIFDNRQKDFGKEKKKNKRAQSYFPCQVKKKKEVQTKTPANRKYVGPKNSWDPTAMTLSQNPAVD